MNTPDPLGLIYVHVVDATVLNGGSDIRFRCLLAQLAQLGEGCIDGVVVTQRGPRSVVSLIERLVGAFSGVPPRFLHPARERSAIRTARRSTGLIIVSTILSASLFRRRDWHRMIYDAHNVEWKVQAQMANGASSLARRLAYRLTTSWARWWEARLAQQAAAVWTVTEADADWFRSVGARRVYVVPNGADGQESPLDPTFGAELLFVGSLKAPFNREGVAWFLDECWPKLRVSLPDAVVSLVGAGSTDFIGDGVRSLGYVENLEPVYRRARSVIVPLLSAGGSRLKIAEALCWGLPIVSTSVGAEGYASGHDKGVCLADSPDEFVAACSKILVNDKFAAAVGAAGFEASYRHTWQAIGEIARESVRQLSAEFTWPDGRLVCVNRRGPRDDHQSGLRR